MEENKVGINKKINGIDILIWFQNKHLLLEDLPEGLALRHTDELTEKFPNVVKVIQEFLLVLNDLEYTIEDEVNDNSRLEN
jgi:hypothetical protein